MLVAGVLSASASAKAEDAIVQEPSNRQAGARGAQFDSDHLALDHSDVGLRSGEYFSALGLHMAAAGTAVGLTIVLLVATQANQSPNDRNAILITAALAAPPLLALPSTEGAYRTAKQRCPRKLSWGWTYLAGVASNALVVGATAAFVTSPAWISYSDVLPSPNELVLAGIFLAGSFLTPGLEVLALNVTSGEPVSVVPIALKGGGGVAIAGAF